MGIFDKMANTFAKKVMIDTAVNAAVKTVGAVADYNSKREYTDARIIKVPNASEHYFGMNYQEVQDELTAYGFTNIALLPKKDLIKGWLTKDGAIETVSINGKTDFKEKRKFPADAHVVITYHTFRDSKLKTRQRAIPKTEELPLACCSNCGAHVAANSKFCLECGLQIMSISLISSEHKKEFSEEIIKCPNCGEVPKSSETFCHACGYELRSAKSTDSMREFTRRLEQMEGLHMTCCSSCGAQIADNTKFCPECGSPNTSDATNSAQRQHEFKGKIIKCPNCGEILKSFAGICPACGHEITSEKMSASFKSFVDGITECDVYIARSPVQPKKGFRTWSKRGKFWWVALNVFTLCIPLAFYLIMPLLGIWGVAAFLPDEKRKATLIKNYAFPNDRESVLEILLYIKSQMAFMASEKIDRNAVYWASIWGHKAEQIYQKAEIIIKGDTISASAHSNIVLNWKKIRKSFGIRAGIALALIVTLIVSMTVSGGPFGLLPNLFKSISNSFVDTFEWPDTELSRLLPQPASNEGEVLNIDAESLKIQVDGLSISQFEAYITKCKENGFSVNSERTGNTYDAYNTDHFYLDLRYTDYSNETELTIYLEAPKIVGVLQWPSTEFTNMIPDPKSNNGEITCNDTEKLWVLVYDYSETKYESYLNEIKESGFAIDSKTDTISYEAYNENGYHITIYDQSNQYDWSELYIVLEAPIKMETIRWPNTKLVKEIPVPKTDFGEIDSESGSSFTVYIGNTTPEEYADYVDACVDKGFTEELYRRDDTHCSGSNAAGSTISVDYIGFRIMKIHIYNYDY